ncbi:MAG: glycoside hydrolase family 3 C-terminal domain-containing protein [bacterium]|nr:glycoside hydrolase family 3 C-terminal domain-containing protein [bacterium]
MKEKQFDPEKYKAAARQAAAEGIVMLKNEDGVLPLPAGSKIALFGRSQFCYYKSGTGSGGLVNTAYVTGILDALKADGRFELNGELMRVYEKWLETHPFDGGKGWAQEPWFQEEMPVSEELAAQARKESDTAVIIIGRTAGEDKDNLKEEGSYLLTGTEERMLKTVCRAFERTVVLLNVGNIIDMKWVEKYCPSAVLYVWQGGQEGGNGVADVLSGDVNPSGRLSDTIAFDLADYPSAKFYGNTVRNFYAEDIYVGYRYFSTFAPEKVLYPFGFGLSYTRFEISAGVEGELPGAAEKSDETGDFGKGTDGTGRKEETRAYTGEAGKEAVSGKNTGKAVTVKIQVKNVGSRAGKEVVQVYCEAPQGVLGKAGRVLCGFAKTGELSPGESEELLLDFSAYELASYDDSGATGYKSCYVLEAGEYVFYVGENVRDAKAAGSITCGTTAAVERLEEAMAPVTPFERMRPAERKADGVYEQGWQEVPLRTTDPAERRLKRLPEEYAYTGDKGYRLADVEAGRASMGDFLAQLTDEELCCMIRGEGMCSPKVTPGTAGAFGGVTESLQKYGIPAGCCADGPSGIRMDCGTVAFAMPNGTCLACTFNLKLVEELYRFEGMELRKNQVDTLLGPGMNIHRNPLNGRNFEYFSEDPVLTGRMAAAQLLGMQRYGVTGTVKHFACNNQEHSRNFAEAAVSERALREIYLKGFEIAVKEGMARSVMSTYGPVNGLWTAGNYDLLTTILRGEWGYRGIVMTDWWAKANDEGKPASIENTAAMVRSQNDLYMVTGDSLSNSNEDNSMAELQKGTVTRGEFQRSAANICRFLLASPAYQRSVGAETELDRELRECAEQDSLSVGALLKVEMRDEAAVDTALIDTAKGKTTTVQVAVKERGTFRLEFFCRASAETADLAQLPLSVFQDKQLIETVTLAGSEKEWKKKTVHFPMPLFHYTFFLKLFFGMSGMELKDMKIVMEESMEERIREAIKKRKENAGE